MTVVEPLLLGVACFCGILSCFTGIPLGLEQTRIRKEEERLLEEERIKNSIQNEENSYFVGVNEPPKTTSSETTLLLAEEYFEYDSFE